jgi:tetratricopeptide (TPR) repeat protein
LTALTHPSLRTGRVPIEQQWAYYWSLTADALHMLGDYQRELVEARKGRQYLPESAEVLGLELRALASLGRVDEVLRQLDRLEAMPHAVGNAKSTFAILVSLSAECSAHGQTDAAQQVLLRAVDWQRSRSQDRLTPDAWTDLARAFYLLGKYDEAARIISRLTSDDPRNPQAIVLEALLAARKNGRSGALQHAEDRLRVLKRRYDWGRTTYARAQLAAQMGDADVALLLLRQAFEQGVAHSPEQHADAMFTTLRSDPRFQALLRPTG